MSKKFISKLNLNNEQYEIKAEYDISGNKIVDTYLAIADANSIIDNRATELDLATKTEVSSAAEQAKTYVDEAIAQKSQVRIVRWGADD